MQTSTNKNSPTFKEKVIKAVNTIPYGKVASYGQIAIMVDVPRGARQVGWVLNSLESDAFKDAIDLPWWRIINNAGRISIKGTKYNDAALQRDLLQSEGVEVSKDFTLDIEMYRYRGD